MQARKPVIQVRSGQWPNVKGKHLLTGPKYHTIVGASTYYCMRTSLSVKVGLSGMR